MKNALYWILAVFEIFQESCFLFDPEVYSSFKFKLAEEKSEGKSSTYTTSLLRVSIFCSRDKLGNFTSNDHESYGIAT